jgi:hypothetical protein
MYEFIAKNTGVTIHVNSYFLRNISRFDQQYGSRDKAREVDVLVPKLE